MPMLHPCSRCTQALPTSAKYCRRCGAAVGELVSPPVPLDRTKPGSLVTSGLTAMVLAALVVGGFFYMNTVTPQAAPAPMQAVPPNVPLQNYMTEKLETPLQPDANSRVRAAPTVVVVPYPDRQRTDGDGRGDRWNDRDRGRR